MTNSETLKIGTEFWWRELRTVIGRDLLDETVAVEQAAQKFDDCRWRHRFTGSCSRALAIVVHSDQHEPVTSRCCYELHQLCRARASSMHQTAVSLVAEAPAMVALTFRKRRTHCNLWRNVQCPHQFLATRWTRDTCLSCGPLLDDPHGQARASDFAATMEWRRGSPEAGSNRQILAQLVETATWWRHFCLRRRPSLYDKLDDRLQHRVGRRSRSNCFNSNDRRRQVPEDSVDHGVLFVLNVGLQLRRRRVRRQRRRCIERPRQAVSHDIKPAWTKFHQEVILVQPIRHQEVILVQPIRLTVKLSGLCPEPPVVSNVLRAWWSVISVNLRPYKKKCQCLQAHKREPHAPKRNTDACTAPMHWWFVDFVHHMHAAPYPISPASITEDRWTFDGWWSRPWLHRSTNSSTGLVLIRQVMDLNAPEITDRTAAEATCPTWTVAMTTLLTVCCWAVVSVSTA